MSHLQIGGLTIEYRSEVPGDKQRRERLIAELSELRELQQVMQSGAWKILSRWVMVKVSDWNYQISQLTRHLDKNREEILALRKQADGLDEMFRLFESVRTDLPDKQRELQEIDQRQKA